LADFAGRFKFPSRCGKGRASSSPGCEAKPPPSLPKTHFGKCNKGAATDTAAWHFTRQTVLSCLVLQLSATPEGSVDHRVNQLIGMHQVKPRQRAFGPGAHWAPSTPWKARQPSLNELAAANWHCQLANLIAAAAALGYEGWNLRARSPQHGSARLVYRLRGRNVFSRNCANGFHTVPLKKPPHPQSEASI
jgi:hypothetical protein